MWWVTHRRCQTAYLVIKPDVYLELEAIWLWHGAQGLQGYAGQAEVEVQPLHRVPGHGQVVLNHPLPAAVESFQLVLLHMYAVLHQLGIHGELEVPGDIARLVVLHTEPQGGIPKERSQSICLDISPTIDDIVQEVEELLLTIDSQFAS